jgi:hypothetical protein
MVEAVTSTAPPEGTNAAGTKSPDRSVYADTPEDKPADTPADMPVERPAGTRTAPPRRSGRLLAAVRRPLGADVAVALLFVLFAAWLTAGLWPDPNNRVLALNAEDQTLYEWFLANDARLLLGDFSLVTDRLNAPDGVNLMANTTVIALGAVLAPVTLAFGAGTTFALIALLNLALTGLAWYLLFARAVGAHRLAALIGGAFCGFAPGILSQNNSHLHMTAQWLVPLMVWCVVRMMRSAAEPDDGRRLLLIALALAALVSVQVFIGEEVLFLTALTLGLMAATYAARRPGLARRAGPRFAAAMLITAVTAAVVLAYPLWTQFAGPQGVHNGLFSPGYFSADLASWPAISPMSLAGSPEAARLSTGPAEYNTFLGWPLLAVTAGCALWLWRRPVVIASVVAGLVMAALSLGPNVVIDGERTGIPGPYRLLQGLPVVDGALPMRFALALIPLVATILVLAVDRALADRAPAGRAPAGRAPADRVRAVRIAVPVVVTAALLPIAPMPVETASRAPVPAYFSAGHWRDCVEPGGVLVPVPLPTPQEPWPMRWAAAVNTEFALPEGFFIGPYGKRGTASIGTFKQPTSRLLADVAKTGQAPPINDGHRQRARTDLTFWNASCVVLADGTPNVAALRGTLERLLGPATRVADVWSWKVG